MSITRQDVQALSAAPGTGGVALTDAETDRVAAVLNCHTAHREPDPDDGPESLVAAPPQGGPATADG